MPAGRLTDVHIVVAAGILTMLLGGAAAYIEPPDGSGAETPSSFSTAAGGGKAAFATLAALGYHVERSFEPMAGIRADPSRTVLVITGAARPSDQDRRALQSFVERGGVTLLVGAQGADLLRVTGAAPARGFVAAPSRHRVLAPSPLTAGVSEITMPAVAGAPAFASSYVALFEVSPEAPLVSTARVGRGRVIWLADPTPLANAHIASADNLRLLLNTVGPPGAREVLWDEHYHGHARSLWSYAVHTPLPWIAAQAGLMTLAVFAARSRRRGPVRPRAVEARTSPMEFIDMLRALYRRSGAHREAVASARLRFARAVVSSGGLPAATSDAALARAAAAHAQLDEREAADALDASGRAATDPTLTPADALTLVQRLQRLTLKIRGNVHA